MSSPEDDVPSPDVSEEEIADTVDQLLAYQAGDDAVLEDLFRRYYPRVVRIVRLRMGSLLRGRMESSDLVQETFAAAVGDLKSVRLAGEGALIHWLAKVAENVIRGKVDYHTALKRDPRFEAELRGLSTDVSSGQFTVSLADPGASPVDEASQRESLRALAECLSELTPEQRDVWLMRRVAGCSVEHVAATMQRSVGAVHMLASRAEARISALMASRDHPLGEP